ncbi:MAG TPA: class I SAM-dependent methyltransferase [Tepidisphaeraceae bacterium]|nr:class I SAM-dependent methyltransferase [Tepidisphaeraceae bacterium]
MAGEPYLMPYLDAARKFGAGFGSLLWASPRTQRARFEAIRGMVEPAGKIILDAGCGRADYLAYLIEQGAAPAGYIGLEAVEELASAAIARHLPGCTIISADFVREPARLFARADVVVFSGSLNTLSDEAFYATLRRAYEAAGEAVVFNFLCSTYLAGREYLFWREPSQVLAFAKSICDDVRCSDDYLRGDYTICMHKRVTAHDSD